MRASEGRGCPGNASETLASEAEPGAGVRRAPGLAGSVGSAPRAGPPGPGLGLDRGQEVSPVWAPGPWHSPSSFLIPGPVGAVGPSRRAAATAWDLLTVSWGTRPPAKPLGPGRAPGPSPATSCSQAGKLRPCIREGHPRQPGDQEELFPTCPPPHALEEQDTLGKPTWWHLRWDLGLGPGSVGAQAGTVQTGAV